MPSESTQQHRQAASGACRPVRVAILTISDTRNPESDKSGSLATELLTAAGHRVPIHEILPDDVDEIRAWLREVADSEEVDAILTNGGTGIARRDGTFEAVSDLLDKVIPGFGELFRMLSWEEVGAASMLSRAVAGLRGNTLIFCLPGSSNAVRLALEKLIIPELPHLVWEIHRQQ